MQAADIVLGTYKTIVLNCVIEFNVMQRAFGEFLQQYNIIVKGAAADGVK